VPHAILSVGKPGTSFVGALLRAGDGGLLRLQAIQKNLRALRRDGRSLQILSKLANFREHLL
jgi:hypothetical protein